MSTHPTVPCAEKDADGSGPLKPTPPDFRLCCFEHAQNSWSQFNERRLLSEERDALARSVLRWLDESARQGPFADSLLDMISSMEKDRRGILAAIGKDLRFWQWAVEELDRRLKKSRTYRTPKSASCVSARSTC